MQQNSELYSVITNREISDAERVKAVEKILEEGGTDINYGENQCGTALHGATLEGHLEIAESLIEKGANVNFRNKDGYTPAHLLFLAKKEKFTLLELFIEKGLNVNIQDNWGKTPLHCILVCPGIFRMDTIVKLFLDRDRDRDININIEISDHRGNTVLHVAAKSTYVAVIKLLVKKGAKIDVKNEEGNTPLHLAVDLGRENIVEYLVEKGAKIDVKNTNGETPLDVAKSFKRSEITEFLQKKEKLQFRTETCPNSYIGAASANNQEKKKGCSIS